MGTRSFALSLALCLMISSGCSGGGSSTLKPAATGEAPAGDHPDPGHGPGPGGQQPIPFPAFTSHLVQEARYLPAAEARLDARDRADLDAEARECGFTDAAVSACLSSKFTAAQIWISAPGPDQLWIQGTAARSRDTGRSYFQIRISTMSRALRTEPVRVRVFSAQADPRSDLGALVTAARARVHAVPAEHRLERLEQALEAVLVAEFEEWTFTDAGSFASAYALQSSSRAFYHWSAVALANGLGYPAVKAGFASRFAGKTAAADATYKEAFLEQGLLAEERWAIGAPLVSAFRTELASARDRALRGKFAVALLIVAPANQAARDQLLAARDFVLEAPELEWVRRGIGLFRKYGGTFGTSSDLARFAVHPARQIRVDAVSAFAGYSDETAEQWILKLNADKYADVRQAALAVIRGRNHDFGAWIVSLLIDDESWSSREGLARALRYATGSGADEALLRLSADPVGSVRDAAYESIAARPFDAGSFEVRSLIDPDSWSSRQGLARALRYVSGQKSIAALVVLANDLVRSVKDAARESLRAHGIRDVT
ncbi:MAG TPA: hypothetical protein VM598_06690 [Bdellovibrionota bacterium]|nr:hypothetical protein [Bdellovibrionota bacterium]